MVWQSFIDKSFPKGYTISSAPQFTLCTAALLPEHQPAHLFSGCYYWTNWLIQACLIIVVTTEIRHTWINQFVQ